MEHRKKVTEKCQGETDKIAKGFCFSLVHQGVLKCLSNSSVIDMYETGYKGLRDICNVWKKGFKDLGGKELAPPLQFALTKNNIGL